MSSSDKEHIYRPIIFLFCANHLNMKASVEHKTTEGGHVKPLKCVVFKMKQWISQGVRSIARAKLRERAPSFDLLATQMDRRAGTKRRPVPVRGIQAETSHTKQRKRIAVTDQNKKVKWNTIAINPHLIRTTAPRRRQRQPRPPCGFRAIRIRTKERVLSSRPPKGIGNKSLNLCGINHDNSEGKTSMQDFESLTIIQDSVEPQRLSTVICNDFPGIYSRGNCHNGAVSWKFLNLW